MSGRRPRRPLWVAALRRLGLGLIVFSAAVAALLLARERLVDREQAEIEAERSARLAQAAQGLPLAGTPDLGDLAGRLSAAGLRLGAPVFIRVFKREFELELWLARGGRFQRFAVYPICRWSGRLGPKLAEGDGQAPEGFYTVDAKALNPASRWHRSFDLGFPNAFDRAHGRTGSYLMVHGGCASIGCFAMTDPAIDEIWRLVTAALAAGQPRFHVHVFPFRMTQENLDRRRSSPWAAFWQELKHGYDAFEATHRPPRVSVCDGRYRIAPAAQGEGGGAVDSACFTLSDGSG